MENPWVSRNARVCVRVPVSILKHRGPSAHSAWRHIDSTSSIFPVCHQLLVDSLSGDPSSYLQTVTQFPEVSPLNPGLGAQPEPIF